jgi:hypothetical protein
VGLGVIAVGICDRVQGVRSGAADRGGRKRGGQLAHTEHSKIALESVQAADVLVQAGERHAEPLRDRREGQPLESDLIGHRGGSGDDAVVGHVGAWHRSAYRFL